MSAETYELLALCMRYIFAALIVLIVLRAWLGATEDSRRAAELRRLSPDTGVIGEMLVIQGGERAREGMRYPLTLEGTIGSGSRADIRVRHHSVRRRHAIYQMTDDGLFVRGHANNRLGDAHGRPVRELMLHDGNLIWVGQVQLMLILSDGGNPVPESRHRPRRKGARRGGDDGDDLFRVGTG